MNRTFILIINIIQAIFSIACPILSAFYDIEFNLIMHFCIFIIVGFLGGATYCLFPFARRPKAFELPFYLSIVALTSVVNIFLYGQKCLIIATLWGLFAILNIIVIYKIHKGNVIK